MTRTRSPRTLIAVGLTLLLLGGLAVLLANDTRGAHAAGTEVRLTGNGANNFFIVRAKTTTELEFCTDLLGCFTRLRSDVQRIDLDGLDGDDAVFIEHTTLFVNHPTVPISLTFVGGAGSDELRVCSIAACTKDITTDVSVLPDTDEVRVVQCLGAKPDGGRCVDEPFVQPVPTLKMNVRGSDVVTDQSRGPLTVLGTAGPDTVTFAGGETFTNRVTGLAEVTGRVSVDNLATIQLLNKHNLTLDTADGADTVVVDGAAPGTDTDRRGFGAIVAPCARDVAPAGAPLCLVTGGETGDRLEIAADDPRGEMQWANRAPAVARLSGFGRPAAIDVDGVDALTLPVSPAAGHTLALLGQTGDDLVTWNSSTPGVLSLAGHLSWGTGATAPLPAIELRGDGSGPIAATFDGLDGADVAQGSTAGDADALALRRADEAAGGAVVRHDVGAVALSAVTVRAERLELATGDGDDVLDATVGAPAEVRWEAAGGGDRLHLAGLGAAVTADLGTGILTEALQPGTLTAVNAETWHVDAAGKSLLVRSTDGADVLRYAAGESSTATVRLDGHATSVKAAGVAGTMILDPAGGDDVVAVEATSTADAIAINRGQFTTTQVADFLPARALDSTESVVVDGRSGDDRFLVSGEGGATTLTLLGGVSTAGDRLSFAAAQSSSTLAFDAAPASGTLTAGGPAIAFRDLEHVDVEGDSTGSFTVEGSDSADTIVQQGATVTVGRGTTATFAAYPSLVLRGHAGDDDVVLSSPSLAGVDDITVGGGDAGTDRVVVRGSELRDTITYQPDAADGGRVEVSFAPPITMTGTEVVEVDGRTGPPSGDTLVLRSPNIDGTVVARPGSAVDAGTLYSEGATGAVTTFPPVHYARLGNGTVVVDGHDLSQAPRDVLRVLGEPDADVLALAAGALAGNSTTTLDSRIPVITTGATVVQLHGLDGQDTFRAPASHGLATGTGPAVVIDAGPPSGGDVAVITATGAVTANLADRTVTGLGERPIAFAGLDRLDVAAGGAGATVLGGSGPDAMTVRPTGVDAAQVTTDLVATRLDLAAAGSLVVDTGDGADALTVLGRSTGEAIGVTRGTLPSVRIGALLPVTATDAVEALRVDGREGADDITVDGTGGPSSLAIDGGEPAADGDIVRLVAPESAVTFGDPATGGRLDSPGGSLTFSGIDLIDVDGDGSGPLTVRGTDAPDTFSLGEPGSPAVRVNGGAAVTHTGYPTLQLDGRGGADTIAVSYANLGDVTAITAHGGNALDDVVRIVDGLGSTRAWEVSPLDADNAVVMADGGVPTITATGTSQLQLIGRGAGDRLQVRSPAGAHDVVVQPGAVIDAGTVRVGSLVPIVFNDLGADGVLAINDPTSGAEDHVVVKGSDGADAIRVTGADRGVRLGTFIPVLADGATALSTRGFAGADTVTATGPLPWATTTFDGGGPGHGDAVTLDGPSDDARVDIGAATVTGFGGTVLVPGIDRLQTSHAARALTIVGTDRDDALCYDPLTPRDGRMHIIASPNGGLLTDSCQPAPGTLDILHTFIDVGRLEVDPDAGADQVLVNGTVNDDAVIVESTGPHVAVSVNPSPADTTTVRLPVHVVTPTTENVIVATDNGVDNVDARIYEAMAPVLTIHGEAPDTRKSDHLTVRDLSGGANINDTGSTLVPGSGTVTVDWRRYSGTAVTVNYTGIEKVTAYKMQRPR